MRLTLSWVCLGLASAGLFNGPSFPIPLAIGRSPSFRDSTSNFTEVLADSLRNGLPGDNGPLNQTSISIGMFSVAQEGMLWEYNWTDPSIRQSKTGTQDVGTSSVFRIGSISKLLTVYLFLVSCGEDRLNDPIAEYVPELVSTPEHDWTQVTVADLADHLSGIQRDVALNEVTAQGVATYGLPPIPSTMIPRCDEITASGVYEACKGQQFMSTVSTESPLFGIGATPAYSNIAFGMLGLILERVTGLPFEEAVQRAMNTPLSLNSTSSVVPQIDKNSVVPGNASSSGWSNELQAESPAAGMFSSVNDLAAIGRAMLNSSLLSRPTTRRWMKPRAFTAEAKESVGLAWEIFRWSIGGRLVDVYTKDGNWGAYAGVFILIPDYHVGLVALTAGMRPGPQHACRAILNWTEAIIAPGLYKAAMEEAVSVYQGQYDAPSGDSTMTISVPDEQGLKIDRFVSNGVDVLAAMANASEIAGLRDLDFRLYPSFFDWADGSKGFTGTNKWVTGDDSYEAWVCVGAPTYGGYSMDQFAFRLDETQRSAVTLEAKAWRLALNRAK